ncbi:MAG: NAD(+)/NADH kinase, partial [Oxalobacter sp.]|nr:NAD(+)/NADH kinase [Oxalobacter sp.]
MQTKKKVFALVSRVYISSITQSMEKVANFLVEAGHTVVYESETASNISLPGITSMNLEEIGAQAEAAIVIGGDGTMLGIARQLAPYSVPMIGIN